MTIGTLSATTDSNGNYDVTNIYPGTYSALVSATNYYPVTNTVTLPPSVQVVTQNFTLSPATNSVSGNVYCSCGDSAIAGASVQIGNYFAQSDTNGAYTITNIPPGTYTASITANNYASLTTNVTVPADVPVVTNNVYLTNLTLVIHPIYDSTILGDVNSLAITNSIQSAIQSVENVVANPLCVTIGFAKLLGQPPQVLGMSSVKYENLSYTQYVSDLQRNQILSANDITALAYLPAGPENPVNLNTEITATTPLLRAIGETNLGNTGSNPDGTMFLNTTNMNLSRTGPQDPTKYDLQTTATHEIDEVLGIGGQGSSLNEVQQGHQSISDPISPLDLFRYSALTNRSYSTNQAILAYFSIDGGTTTNVHFNQNTNGDYGDWGNGSIPANQTGNVPPQVQDAFETPGKMPILGRNELISLDVVGYNLLIPPPIAQNVTYSSNTFAFNWPTVPGQSYQVLYSTGLSGNNWTNLGETITADDLAASASDTNASTLQRFYRVAAVPQPAAAAVLSRSPQVIATSLPNVTNNLVRTNFLPATH